MSAPVTTLQDVILLAHEEYGIRFQVSQAQLVKFANMVQHIAYNKDLAAFEEWGQVMKLGQDVWLNTDVTYTSPIEADIGKSVSGNTLGTFGTLLNFRTQNRLNKWIIEPPDGGTNITIPDGEILTIAGGSVATGVICDGQAFEVSKGPYRMPSVADGNPPYRKLIGITTVSDETIFHVPANSGYNGPDDYGLITDNEPGRRSFFPYRFDQVSEVQEITLVTSTALEILQTEKACGPSGTTLNTSRLRWAYYRNPPAIESIEDEANIVIPEEYRYEVLYKGISAFANTATYGDQGSVREMMIPICSKFWEDAQTQYQAFGRGSDWISHGDNISDLSTLGDSSGGHNGDRYFGRGGNWN